MLDEEPEREPVLIIAESVEPVVAARDDGSWVAAFPELDLAADGATEEEARLAVGRLYMSVAHEPWLLERWEAARRDSPPNWTTHLVSKERYREFWEEAERTGELPEL